MNVTKDPASETQSENQNARSSRLRSTPKMAVVRRKPDESMRTIMVRVATSAREAGAPYLERLLAGRLQADRCRDRIGVNASQETTVSRVHSGGRPTRDESALAGQYGNGPGCLAFEAIESIGTCAGDYPASHLLR